MIVYLSARETAPPGRIRQSWMALHEMPGFDSCGLPPWRQEQIRRDGHPMDEDLSMGPRRGWGTRNHFSELDTSRKLNGSRRRDRVGPASEGVGRTGGVDVGYEC